MSNIGIYSVRDMEVFIEKNYGDLVSWDGKQKSLIKFGSNPDVGTALEDVWNVGGIEILPSDNLITHIASTSGSDTTTIAIEGHTIDANGDLTFAVQTATLAGQTKTALTTPLARCTRAYASGSADLIGNVYIAKDVTFTSGVPASDIHNLITAGQNQSQKCSTSTSQNDYWVITQVTASVKRQNTRKVDFFVQTREKGKIWRTRFQPISVSDTAGTILIRTDIPFIVPPNTDIRVQAISSGATTEIGSALFGTLMIKQSAIYD